MATAKVTLFLTSPKITRHDEMCETCWKTGIITIPCAILSDTGVRDYTKTFCLTCRQEE
jgi:hypothetical protein